MKQKHGEVYLRSQNFHFQSVIFAWEGGFCSLLFIDIVVSRARADSIFGVYNLGRCVSWRIEMVCDEKIGN